MTNSTIKVPRRSSRSRIERLLAKTVQDGTWYKLLTMGQTTAEQIARSYNVPGASWEFGYTQGSEKGEIVSYLWVRWVG